MLCSRHAIILFNCQMYIIFEDLTAYFNISRLEGTSISCLLSKKAKQQWKMMNEQRPKVDCDQLTVNHKTCIPSR